jgi:hypothetical protein
MIVLHAAAGVLCFVAGVAVLGLQTARSTWLVVYLAALAGMTVFVAAAVAAGWSGYDGGTRVTFGALIALALFMCWRAYRAVVELRTQPPGWRSRYLAHIGFTLISLFDGFVIVAAIDLGAPGWLVALIAVAGVVVGIQLLNRAKARYR